MTDMQLLLPPLEDGTSEDVASRSGDGRTTPQESSNDQLGAGDNNNSNLLTPQLRESFETMKSIWRNSRRDGDRSSETDAEGLKRKQRELAVETALAVNSEISRLESGIAELEALLNVPQHHDDEEDNDEDSTSGDNSDAEDGPQDYHPVDNPAAPIVLPIVIPVEDDHETPTDRESNDSSTDGSESFRENDEAMMSASPPATPSRESSQGVGH